MSFLDRTGSMKPQMAFAVGSMGSWRGEVAAEGLLFGESAAWAVKSPAAAGPPT